MTRKRVRDATTGTWTYEYNFLSSKVDTTAGSLSGVATGCSASIADKYNEDTKSDLNSAATSMLDCLFSVCQHYVFTPGVYKQNFLF